jgi:hypothetical protein
MDECQLRADIVKKSKRHSSKQQSFASRPVLFACYGKHNGNSSLQGIERAKAEKRYRGGRPENAGRNGEIAVMLKEGKSWVRIMKATGCARGTVAKIALRLGETQATA